MKLSSTTKNKIKVASILLAAFPLLMSNSPAPYRGPTTYIDFKVNNFSISQATGIEQTLYSHSFDIENTGPGYMVLTTYNVYELGSGLYLDNYNKYRSDEVIAPNCSYHFSFIAEEEHSYDKLQISFEAFNGDFVYGAVKFDNYCDFSKVQEAEDNLYVYSFHCEYELLTDEYGHYYNPIFKFKDKDSIHYFYGGTIQNNYTFYADADMDMDSLSIEAVTFVKGYEYYRDITVSENSVPRTIFFVFMIMGLSLTLAGAIVGVVFLIRHIKKSKG